MQDTLFFGGQIVTSGEPSTWGLIAFAFETRATILLPTNKFLPSHSSIRKDSLDFSFPHNDGEDHSSAATTTRQNPSKQGSDSRK